MSNLTQRIITALIGASILLAGIIYSEQTFLLLLLFISTMSLLEFYRICGLAGLNPQKGIGLAINAVIFLPPLIQNLFQTGFNLLPLIIILPFFIFIRELYSASDKPLQNISATLLGNIYLSIPLFCFYLVSFLGTHGEYSYECILGYFFILWANDTGAYFTGRSIGRRKLFERISPKKTWEGFFGGLVTAVAVAWLVSVYFGSFSRFDWLIIALLIVTTGTLGDLVESMFKRSVQIKDSGTIIPGHGGFLDRFDALFISAPFVFFYLQVWK